MVFIHMVELGALNRIGEGRLSTVYQLDPARILKVFKYPHVAEVEFRQTNAVWQAGVSRQRPHSMTCVDGQDAIIYDYLDGKLLMDVIRDDTRHVLRHIRRLAECHAAILNGSSNNLPSYRDGVQYAIIHAPHITDGQRACLLSGLKAMPDGNHVLHGDLHPMNILVCADGLFAIDWMTGSRGDPAADIARSWFMLRYSSAGNSNLLEEMAQPVLARVYLDRVCVVTGVDKRKVMKWLPFVAAARLTEDRPAGEVRVIQQIVGQHCGPAVK